MSLADQVGGLLGFVLTLLVFSYLLGDNPLFRFTVHLFIGVAAGFAAIMAINSVLLPHLAVPLLKGSTSERLLALAPLVLGGLLLTKASPRLSSWGNLPMAYLVGVGAAVAIGGAISGTLFPQALASINLLDRDTAQAFESGLAVSVLNGLVMIIGTIASLAFFHFGIRTRPEQASAPPAWMASLGQVGQVFIAIALGFVFAGVLSAALVALIERLVYLVDFVRTVLLVWIS
jgi:hypothetical protein